MKLKRRHFEWIGIAFLALAALLYSQPEVSISGNESTRFAVIQAVGEQHVFHIEKTNFRTVDRVIRNNHVYSDKPLPIGWGLGMVHRVLHGVTGWNFFDNYNLLIYLFNLGFSGAINILLFVWSFRQFCRVRRGSVPLKFLLALGMCIGTWLFSYSVTVNNHTPAALAVLGLYIVLEKYRRRPSRRLAAAAGLTAGLVAAADLPVGAIFAVAAVAALWLLAPRRERISAETACIGCGLAVGVWLLLLNYTAYGTVVPLYVAGSEGTFRVVNPGWAYRMSYFFECLLGCRGLFSYQQFLLFALPGAYFLWRGGRFSRVDKVFLVAVAAVMLFYLFFTVEFGGWAYGFRYLVPVIPILWLFAGRWLLEAHFRLLKCAVAAPLIAAGVVTALAGAYSPFCVAYEGVNSPPGHFTRNVRSTFLGNVFAWSFASDENSALTRALLRHYGPADSMNFLHNTYFNLKRPDLLRKVAERTAQLLREERADQHHVERGSAEDRKQ